MTASITLTPDTLIIDIEGTDKLWALKSRLQIPLANVAAIALQRQKTSPATPPETPASQIKAAEPDHRSSPGTGHPPPRPTQQPPPRRKTKRHPPN